MNILFVCTGNTCRSCMAEAIFNKMYTSGDAVALSAGISVINGSKTSKHSGSLVLNKLGKDISEREAVQLTKGMLEEADLVLTMTTYMKELLISNIPNISKKVFSMTEYVGLHGDVIDPYGGTIEVYEKTYDMLENIIGRLILQIKEDKGI